MLSCFRKQHHGISSDTASSSSSLLLLLFIHATLEWIQSNQIQCVANYVRIRSHSTPEHLGSSRNSATFKEISLGRLKLIEQDFLNNAGKTGNASIPFLLRHPIFMGILALWDQKGKKPATQVRLCEAWAESGKIHSCKRILRCFDWILIAF